MVDFSWSLAKAAPLQTAASIAYRPDMVPGGSLLAPLDQTLLYPEVTGTCPMLVDGGGHRWPPPEVCFDRPPGASIRGKGKRYLYATTAGAAHASPLLDAGVDDYPQLSGRHDVFARMLRDRISEQVVAQPPEPSQRARDKSLHGHPITPRNGLTSPRPQLVWLAQTGQDAKGRQVMVRSSTRSKRRILLCDMPAGPRKPVSA